MPHTHKPHGSNGCDACLDLWFALPVGAPIILPNRWRESDKLRNQARPTVLGHELDPATLTPIRRHVDTQTPGDYGADPLGDGMFRMIPSGDIVDTTERDCRLVGRD